jgi:hypothetical protein
LYSVDESRPVPVEILDGRLYLQVEVDMNLEQTGPDEGHYEYREVRAVIAARTRLTPLAFDKHVRRGYLPSPVRLPGRSWRWYPAADVGRILDLCRRRGWMTS